MCKTLKQVVFISLVLSVGLTACTKNDSSELDNTAAIGQSEMETMRLAQDSLNVAARSVEQLLSVIGSGEHNTLKAASEQIYDVVVMGDCELDCRGVTYNELYAKLGKVAGIGTRYTNLRYNDGSVVQRPELALIGGDLTGDRAETVSWNNLRKILAQFNNNGIFAFANIGNHDWDPRQWSDGSYGYTYNGHSSNVRSITGVLSIFNDALTSISSKGAFGNFSSIDSPRYTSVSKMNWWGLSYDLITSAPIYGFTYRGVDYVMAPTFLYEPTAKVTTKSFLGQSPASFSVGLSASYLADRARRVGAAARIYVQHYPYWCDNSWWNDYTGKSAATLRANFNTAIKSAKVSAMFSGHTHQSMTRSTGVVTDYTTGYAGNAGGGAWFLMVRVSSYRGVLQVKEFNTSWF